ncbi:hypothetical protein BJX63DRAFT_438128 [Aspergillus granulosus]|uniref:LysM domain-containing protein n=1 Tax=Aspergillus granulosus TaxID=176169 RepID=A0ABR4GSY8_9EURO
MDVLVGHMACFSYPGNETSTDNLYATKPAGGTTTTTAPAPTNLAPDVNPDCGKYYQVKDDCCQAIAMKNHIMLDDFYFLNPGIDKNCTNLWLNYNYCVSPVGNIETYPGYAIVTGGPTTSRFMPTLPETAIDWSDLPLATLTPWTPLPTPTTLPLANGTRKDCKEYKDNTRGEIACQWFTGQINFFQMGRIWSQSTWNLPVNAAPNSTYECYEWYETEEGDTCDSVLQVANIALDAFYAWNPSVKDDCSNMWLNTSYCLLGEGYEDTFYPFYRIQPANTNQHMLR